MKRFNYNVAKLRNPSNGFEGLPAIAGESAYEIAVRLGTFTGTEEEWNNYIKTERDAAIKAIQDKAKEIMESIPEDYTVLSSEVTELKSDLSHLHNTPTFTTSNGCISRLNATGDGKINAFDGYKYTSPIELKANQTIHVYCKNYTGENFYSAICSIVNDDLSKIVPVIVADEGTVLKWYKYTAGFDCLVSLSYASDYEPKIFIEDGTIEENTRYPSCNVTTDLILNSKQIGDNKDWLLTSPFQASKGEIICVESNSDNPYEYRTSSLSSCDSDGNIIDNLLYPFDNSKLYYEVLEDGYFRASGRKDSTFKISIINIDKNIVKHFRYGYARGNAYTGVTIQSANSGSIHVSLPIYLKKGDRFVYRVTNYYGEVATLVECTSDGTPTKFIRSCYSENNEYYFVANKDMYILMTYDDRYPYYGYIESNYSKYVNKTWCVFGDSLTEKNLRALMNYHDFVAQNLGINVINYGLSGSGYKNGGKWYTRIATISEDFDVCTLFGSFNDLSHEVGNVTDDGTDTICGCINTTLDLFYTTYPNKKIGIITPTPWSVSYENGSILTTKSEQYVNALMTIAKMRGIPCLDLYHNSGLRPWDEDFRTSYYREYNTSTGQYEQDNGTHPNSKGHEYFAYMVEEFIKTII